MLACTSLGGTTVYVSAFAAAPQPAGSGDTPTRSQNIMEAPQVFLASLLLILVLKLDDGLFVQLAWAYVAARVAHSLVHLTVNIVLVRFIAFLASTLCLFAIVGRLAWTVLMNGSSL